MILPSVLKTVEKIKEKPKPQVKQPEKKPEKKEDAFLKVAESLKKKKKPKPQQQQSAFLSAGSQLSSSEMNAVKQQIAGCWNIQPGARDAENLVVRLKVQMNPDMTVRSVQIVDDGESSNPFWSSAARSARTAVLKCSPLRLPPDKYDVWKDINFTFDPKTDVWLKGILTISWHRCACGRTRL